MSLFHSAIRTAAALGLLATAGLCAGQQMSPAEVASTAELQGLVSDLRARNAALEKAVAQANLAEREASTQLAEVRKRLEALGRDLLDGGNERLIQATADIQILNERIEALEGASMQFASVVSDYLRQAVAADPDARLRVESAMRELDEVLGLRQKPAPAVPDAGHAGRARVVSIDAETGLLVLNVGTRSGARIGTSYRLFRGDQAYGSAIIADTRRSIAGAFVEELDPGMGPVRLGDLAILETE